MKIALLIFNSKLSQIDSIFISEIMRTLCYCCGFPHKLNEKHLLASQLWDLTAGKLLHDFKCHDGQIQCIDFHPHEFLLATG